MEPAIRNKLRNTVTQCRKLLEESIAQTLQGHFGIYRGNKDEVYAEDASRMTHLSAEDQAYRGDILDSLEYIKAVGSKPKEALDQLIREIAFTHLNRLCAYKMMEARQVWIGCQRFREAVSRGQRSQGFMFYLADYPQDEQLFRTGQQDVAYRHFLDWLGSALSEEIGVLFSTNDPANRLYPPQRVLDEVLALINSEELAGIWTEDETIGAITSRTGFFLSSFQKWREEILLREAWPSVFADLGYGVLDTAMVETAAYCLSKAAPAG